MNESPTNILQGKGRNASQKWLTQTVITSTESNCILAVIEVSQVERSSLGRLRFQLKPFKNLVMFGVIWLGRFANELLGGVASYAASKSQCQAKERHTAPMHERGII